MWTFTGLLWMAVFVIIYTGCEAEGVCRNPEISNGIIINNKTSYSGGDTIKIMCETGYKRYGKDRLKCMDNSHWDKTPPYCKEITCDLPASLINGTVLINYGNGNGSFKTGDDALFSCHKNYMQIGPPLWTCGISGTWDSHVMPRCEEVKCPQLPVYPKLKQPQNALPGKNVTLECKEGYHLYGTSVLFCGTDGRWFPNRLPECKGKQDNFRTRFYVALGLAVAFFIILAGQLVVKIWRIYCKKGNKPQNRRGGGNKDMEMGKKVSQDEQLIQENRQPNNDHKEGK